MHGIINTCMNILCVDEFAQHESSFEAASRALAAGDALDTIALALRARLWPSGAHEPGVGRVDAGGDAQQRRA
jgi:hypothetical protein